MRRSCASAASAARSRSPRARCATAARCAPRPRRSISTAGATRRQFPLRSKPIVPRGLSGNQKENARCVEKVFDRSKPRSSIVQEPAITTLDDLPDEICPWCAKGFEQRTGRGGRQIYCSKECTRAANYEEFQGWRAHVRAALICVDCRKPIIGARRQDKKLCAECLGRHLLENRKASRLRAKAGTTGRRGTNQFGRVE
jgi:hypothetical protein